MLGVSENTISHDTKTCVLTRLTSLRLQHLKVNVFLWIVQFLTDAFTASFIGLVSPTIVDFRIQPHETITSPLDLEEARDSLMEGSILGCIVSRKPLIFHIRKLFSLIFFHQHFDTLSSQTHVRRLGNHFQILKVSPVQKSSSKRNKTPACAILRR